MGPIKSVGVKLGTQKDFYSLMFFSDDLTLLHCSFTRFWQMLLSGVLGTPYSAGPPLFPKAAREDCF